MTFNTLHMCNASDIKNIKEYCELISENDAVVFYAKYLTSSQYDQLCFLFKNHRIFFIIDNNIHKHQVISYDKWLDLVNQYEKTFTWK